MADVERERHEMLYRAIVEAQAIWFDTPAHGYLDRPEGPVYLDHLEDRPIVRVSGSCHHDLALSLAVGLLGWIVEAVPASDYAAAMRFYTAAGDHVSERLTGLVALVRCECQQGIARWREKAGQSSIAAGADRDQAEPGQLEVDKPKRRKPGRPTDTDPKADKRIFDAWNTGQYKTYEDLARKLGLKKRDVKLVIDRHRRRLEREVK